ncbi:MAG: NDP-sugar synthase [Candidatus Aenigmarchaeota archaeon]|nr:NDP-sugar synthase [Candidatus Aenigmarchaeota archaeon]
MKRAQKYDITAIAPLGGSGTRLYPLTIETPKHLLPIATSTIFNRSVKWWASQGIRRFVLGVTGYDNRVQTYRFFAHGGRLEREFPEIEFRYSNYHDREYADRGSADVFMWALDHYKDDLRGQDILLINGDNLSETSLDDFYAAHKDRKAALSIAVKGLEHDDPRLRDFGTVVFDDRTMKVTQFVEKSLNPPSRFANAAICLFSPEIMETFASPEISGIISELRAENRGFDVGGRLIPFMVKNGFDVYAYPLNGLWSDIGTPHSYRGTTDDILRGGYPQFRSNEESKTQAGKELDYYERVGDSLVHTTTKKRLGDARLKASLKGHCIIGKDVDIGPGSTIRNSVIDDSCYLGNGVHIDGVTTAFPFVRIEDGARVANSIIGYNVIVGHGANLAPGSVLADNLNIPADFEIGVDWRVVGNAHRNKVMDPKNNYAVVEELEEMDAFAFR